MGEWSEYFEDFPEENPANWISGRFDPQKQRHCTINVKRNSRRRIEQQTPNCAA